MSDTYGDANPVEHRRFGQVIAQLEQLGYTNVRKYPDGIQDWVEAGLPTEQGVPAR